MVRIKPFRGIRPPKQYASEVASRPYDVLNSAEAKAEATERSLLHIIKPEIDFDPIADEHSQEVYDKAVENFRAWREKGWLEQDPEEYYYIYAQTMDGRTQYGLTMCCNYEDYLSGAIKKHELTRPDKEEDRMIHVRNQKANIEPVFFAYPDNAEIDAIVAGVVENNAPEYDLRPPTASDTNCGLSVTGRPTTALRRFSRIFRRCTSPTAITARPPRRVWDRSASAGIPTIRGVRSTATSLL